MKTQVSILVKNESLFSRFYSFMWFINIFKKMPVDIYIDSENAAPRRLKASKTPYEIDLEPGAHAILFVDPRAKSKQTFSKIGGAFMGAMASGAVGGSFLAGGALGANVASSNTVRDGYAEFFLKEGDVLKLSAKPTRKGAVKIKILKDK